MSQPLVPRTTTEEYSPASADASAVGHPVLLCAFPTQVALPLPAPSATVGRAWLADAGVRDTRVSGDHLRFSRADGRVYVEDVGSRNGTWIGGVRVAPLLFDEWSANVRDLDRVAAAVVSAGQLTLAVVEKELQPRSRESALTREAAEQMVRECGGSEREVERRFGIKRGRLRRALGKVGTSGQAT